GAVWEQQKDKKLHAIYYASHTLDEAQRNHGTTKKELLVVGFALEKFRQYLVGPRVIDDKERRITASDTTAILLQEFDMAIKNKRELDTGAAPHVSCTKADERRPLKQQPVIGYDPSKCTTERLWATARDGTRVPVTLVCRNGFEK